MKKTLYLLLMLAAMAVFAACSSGGADDSMTDTTESAMEDTISDTAMDDMSEDAMHDDDMSDDTMHDETMSDDSMDDKSKSDEMMSGDDMADDDMSGDSMGEDMADDSMADDSAMMELPAWQQFTLTNARSGESFKLSDFHGKTIFVEPMATWCTNCRQQLTNVGQARAELGDTDTVYVALSLETTLSDEALAQYADNQGFDWLFAVLSPEMLQELVNTFGRSITSAPSTPHFVIRPDGSYTELVTGIESADQITAQILAAGG